MMICLSNFPRRSPHQPPLSGGYTLVEILVALALTLILMTAVVKVFGDVGPSISNARKALEQFDRLRTAAQQLNQDLNNTTARLDGRAGRPEEALGYFELIEGSYLFLNPQIPVGNANLGNPPTVSGNYPYYAIEPSTVTGKYYYDYSVGERGDILMFTVRNAARPYVGRYNPAGNSPSTVQSDVAEIAWYLRGNRLHRRVLLVVPGAAQALTAYTNKANYYNDNDISARLVTANGKSHIVPNSLADLVKRENRFGHPTWTGNTSKPQPPGLFPFDVRWWGTYSLPTLAECTSPSWMANWQNGTTPAPTGTTIPSAKTAQPPGEVDMWNNSPNGAVSVASILPDQLLNNPKNSPNPDGQRISDDVVLTNVIGFDVKVWEPAANNGAGGYIDLGSPVMVNGQTQQNGVISLTNFSPPQGPTVPRFNNYGIKESGLAGSGTAGIATTACVYDTGCFYENEGIYHLDQNGNIQVDTPGGESTNGLDDDNDGIVDDKTEQLSTPPYPVPLRGIQIKIRCFEPDSRQIREVTIEHDFLPK
jgi:type II secretory pathway pseudopilin PulG